MSETSQTVTATANPGAASQQTASQAQSAQAREFSHSQKTQNESQNDEQSEETAQAEAKPQKRYLSETDEEALVRLKIEGKEQEIPLKELKRLSALDKVSTRRMQEAAKVQKQAQQIMEALEKDPAELFKMLGKDFDALAEERLAKKYEMMQMSPEQRRAMELEQQVQQMQAKDYESKKGVIEEIQKLSDQAPKNLEKYSKEDLIQYRDHLASVHQQAEQSLQQEIVQAWDETKLPKHKMWGTWMAMEMMNHQKRSGEPLQAKEAAAKVKKDWLSFNQQILGAMDGEGLHQALGNEIVRKIIDHNVQRATSQASFGQPKSPVSQTASEQPKKQLNQLEWRRAMGLD